MKPSKIYRGSFVNTETDRPDNANIQKVIFVDIADTDVLIGDSDPQEIIDIELAEQPAITSVIDNSEEPFTPIRAWQATISCYTFPGFDISLFADGADQRFQVILYREDGFIYLQGFLSTADLQQEFLPDPNILTLTATDGLGLLNDIDLTDFDGDVPQNEQQIIDFIAWCLAKTGNTNMVIACVMNVRHKLATTIDADTTGAGHFYKYCWLNALTFEDGIGKRLNCYEVLTRILGDMCTMFQYNGEWWIRNLDEIEYGRDYYVTRFDSSGAWIANSVEVYERLVGVDLPLSWMNDDAVVLLERLFKKITETFKYELPEEVPCNVDFSRGDRHASLDGSYDEDNDGGSRAYEASDIECWVMKSGLPTAYDTTDSVAYIRRFFNDVDSENSRYIVITPQSSSDFFTYLESSAIPIQKNDKFAASVSYRYPSSYTTGTGYYFNRYVIHGDDGSWWILGWESFSDSSTPPKWYNTTNWTVNTGAGVRGLSPDNNDWTSAAIELSPPAPVSGKMYIWLSQFNQSGATSLDNQDIFYSDLSLTMYPYINGTYRTYTGQEHSVTQTANTINVRAKQIYVSDSPSQAFKGSILVANTGTLIYTDNTDFLAPDTFTVPGDRTSTFTPGRRIRIDFTASNNRTVTIVSSIYHIIPNNTEVTVLESVITEDDQPATFYDASFSLANEFYSGHVYPSGGFPDDAVHPFGHLQAFDIWNQFNRVMRRFEGTVDGTADIPSLLHKYFLTDTNPNTNDRIFQLLHTEIELHLCQWSAYFAEVVKSDVPKNYDGHAFKYLTN